MLDTLKRERDREREREENWKDGKTSWRLSHDNNVQHKNNDFPPENERCDRRTTLDGLTGFDRGDSQQIGVDVIF